MAATFGPTFGDEVVAAGLGGAPISWTESEIFGREKLTSQQNTTLTGVMTTHDPTKQRKSICTADEFISRWTNAEYLLLEKKRAADIAANKVGNAKNWDIVCAGDIIDLNKQKAQSLKADLVTDGVLTQARADVIFA